MKGISGIKELYGGEGTESRSLLEFSFLGVFHDFEDFISIFSFSISAVVVLDLSVLAFDVAQKIMFHAFRDWDMSSHFSITISSMSLLENVG